jgi:hypothetical protein
VRGSSSHDTGQDGGKNELVGSTVAKRIRRTLAVSLGLSACCIAMGTGAVPITVSQPFLQLYHAALNSDGFATGRLIRFGADSVMPDGDGGTTGFASTTNTSSGLPITRTISFNPGPASPHLFTRSINFNPGLLGPWTLNFQNGTDLYASPTALTLPAGATEAAFVNSITLSGTATNPTFSWTVPPGTTVNG